MRAREREDYVRFVHARHGPLYRAAFLLTGNHHTVVTSGQSYRMSHARTRQGGESPTR